LRRNCAMSTRRSAAVARRLAFADSVLMRPTVAVVQANCVVCLNSLTD
jgi:hypothetical protein